MHRARTWGVAVVVVAALTGCRHYATATPVVVSPPPVQHVVIHHVTTPAPLSRLYRNTFTPPRKPPLHQRVLHALRPKR